MDDIGFADLRHRLNLRAAAQKKFGERAWRLLEGYGKLMGGPYAGLYVSALPVEEQTSIAKRLFDGECMDIHLMHRHRSGDHAISSLRWDGTQLVMVFECGNQLA